MPDYIHLLTTFYWFRLIEFVLISDNQKQLKLIVKKKFR
jgi:hypothetical protein